jgi:flagellar FliL protein
LRTLSLQQVQGARGFRYVRDDLIERAILRSKGNIENILIRTFVIE